MKKKIISITVFGLLLATIIILDYIYKTNLHSDADTVPKIEEIVKPDQEQPNNNTIPAPDGSEPDVLPGTSFFYETVLYTFIENNELELSEMCVDVGETKAVIPEYIPYNGHSYVVTRIGENAFQNYCKNVTEIIFTKSISEVGHDAFKGTKWLQAYENSEFGFLSVGDSVLVDYFGNETEIEIPEGTKNIGSAFWGNKQIKKVTIPPTVHKIGDQAFYACTSLEEIMIPDSIQRIGTSAFFGTPWLKNQKDEYCIVGDNILLKYNGTASVVELPTGIKAIAPAAFQGKKTEKIIMPDTITILMPEACAYLPELKEIALSNRISTIGKNAFAMCTSLRSIQLPASLNAMGQAVFADCKNLQEIKIPEKVKSIYSLDYFGLNAGTSVSVVYLP